MPFSMPIRAIPTGSAILSLHNAGRKDEAGSLILQRSDEARNGNESVAKELRDLLLYLQEYVRARRSDFSPTARFVQFVLGFPPRINESEDVLAGVLGPRRPRGATAPFRDAAAMGLFLLTSGRDGPSLIEVPAYWGYVVEVYLTDAPFQLPPIRADLLDEPRYREHLDWALRRAESRRPRKPPRRDDLRAAALGSIWDAVQPADSVPAEIRRPFFKRTLGLVEERPDLFLPVIARNAPTLIQKGIATSGEIADLRRWRRLAIRP